MSGRQGSPRAESIKEVLVARENRIVFLDETRDVAEEETQETGAHTETTSRRPSIPRERTASVSVRPIRSLSIRQPPHYPSNADLHPQDDVASSPAVRRTASATIMRTIERLEELLSEAQKIAHMVTGTEPVVRIPQPELELRTPPTTRPSQDIRTRAAPIIGSSDARGLRVLPSSHKSVKQITLAANYERSKNASVPRKQENDTDALRACGTAHDLGDGIKSSLSPAAISPEFELEPMIPHRRMKTRFFENSGSKTPSPTASLPNLPRAAAVPLRGSQVLLSQSRKGSSSSLSKRGIKQHRKLHQETAIRPRSTSSLGAASTTRSKPTHSTSLPPALKGCRDLPRIEVEGVECKDSSPQLQADVSMTLSVPEPGHERHFSQVFGVSSRQGSIDFAHPTRAATHKVDLKRRRHVDIPDKAHEFDIHESCHHAPVARNWPTERKRFAATVACINAACIGIVIGIYSGEVPAIQYVIADFHHYAILGNVFLYLGLAVPTLLLWPLPLLHGRKPYIVASLTIALCLQIPQGISVGEFRSPNTATYRALLLVSRAILGFALGFTNINIQSTLLDLFGASLQSSRPHQEVADQFDVRRHGGGMGLWLGIWSWCSVGSISIGFMLGAYIISGLPVN